MHSFLTLETSENRKVFWCLQGLEKGYIGNEWVNEGAGSLDLAVLKLFVSFPRKYTWDNPFLLKSATC